MPFAHINGSPLERALAVHRRATEGLAMAKILAW